jgi:hypothetical protein
MKHNVIINEDESSLFSDQRHLDELRKMFGTLPGRSLPPDALKVEAQVQKGRHRFDKNGGSCDKNCGKQETNDDKRETEDDLQLLPRFVR